jgi:catechol 2,3-dioxygenase-like lactoylglutathione lyase family enzyme
MRTVAGAQSDRSRTGVRLVPDWCQTALILAVLAAAVPHAQSPAAAKWTAPRTPWGHPDLQGYWTNTTTTPLQRPADLKDKALLSDAELAERDRIVAERANQDRPPSAGNPGTYNDFWYERGVLTHRTSLIVDPPDGRLPALTAEAQKRAADARAGHGPSDSPEDRSAFERCITRSLPGAMLPGFYNHNYYIMQTPTHVVINIEMIHDARIIPLDGRPQPGSTIHQWMGSSRGRWEGDTLVVETTHFNDKVREQSLIAFSTGQNLRLVERFTRTGPETIDYQFTVEDQSFYVRPWTASAPMTRIDGPIFEYACHEGNYGMGGILRGARAEEQRSAPVQGSVAPAVRATGFHNVHLRVTDPVAAADWYIKYLGATKAPAPFSVAFGRTLIALVRTDKPQPSEGSVIDHIGLSYADLRSRMRNFEAGGAKIVTPVSEAPGLFAYGYIEDPWGVKIEVMQDTELLGFHHVHLRVADPAAALQWFNGMLGGQAGKLRDRVDGVRYGDVWVFAARSEAPLSPSAVRAVMSLAVEVANVDESAAALKERGARLVSGPAQAGAVRYAFFDDPNGVRVELVNHVR